MKYVAVKFKNSAKQYVYKTKLDLMVGYVYDIVTDNRTSYGNFVKVLRVENKSFFGDDSEFREITSAKIITGQKRTDGNVKDIYINEEKDTVVVVWKDGSKTKVKRQEGDVFDAEKGIAMCFMKKAFDNRSCFNEIIKKYVYKED